MFGRLHVELAVRGGELGVLLYFGRRDRNPHFLAGMLLQTR
jgi:hypothetical protein